MKDRVLLMTFSEFGRTVHENGSAGTDHGTAAPMFLLGSSVTGGLHGTMPNLNQTDENGDPAHTVDFRAVYAAVLQQWFGLDAATIEATFGKAIEPMALIGGSQPVSIGEKAPDGPVALEGNYPNPFRNQTRIRFNAPAATNVRLEVFDVQGKRVRVLLDAAVQAGQQEVSFHADGLPSGTYFYRLTTNGGVQTKSMVLL